MTQKEVFELAVRKLDEMDVPYMVCGSVAAMIYGEPRLTNDMDVVIALAPSKVRAFCETFAACGFYCPPPETVIDELRQHGQFNLLHPEAGVKIDCIVLKAEPFSREEFARRQRLPFTESVQANIARPEDVILKKLEYYKQGGSTKHLEDVRSMLRVSPEEIDMNYLNRWVAELGLADPWKEAQAK